MIINIRWVLRIQIQTGDYLSIHQIKVSEAKSTAGILNDPQIR